MRNLLFACLAMSPRVMALTRAQAFSSRNGMNFDSEYVNAMRPPRLRIWPQRRGDTEQKGLLCGSATLRLHLVRHFRRYASVLTRFPSAFVNRSFLGNPCPRWGVKPSAYATAFERKSRARSALHRFIDRRYSSSPCW